MLASATVFGAKHGASGGEATAPAWWGRKVVRLPSKGTLIYATDLQGNLGDYHALKAIYEAESAAGSDPTMLFCGDLVHGPSRDLENRAQWPEFLGSFYKDQSAPLILDFIRYCGHAKVLSLLGNHEHAHIGGPTVSKFHADEAAVLDEALGEHRGLVETFLSGLPLIAVAPCGAVFTHGAPRATEPNLEAFEQLRYDGYQATAINDMYESSTVGALLWSRYAEPERARELLAATTLDGRPNAFVAYGHDVVREGYERVGDEQICVSTSFGCDDANKYYLRLDLSARYNNVHDLRMGHELRRLYPDA